MILDSDTLIFVVAVRVYSFSLVCGIFASNKYPLDC